jgi:protein SCO1
VIHSRTRFRVTLTAAGLAFLAGCAAPEPGEAGPELAAGHDHVAHDHAAADEMPASHPADFSIYHAASLWTDQHGERRPLESLGGRVRVVGMVYTNCAYACPRMVLDMKRIEDEMGATGDVGFVLVSIDPDRDTPERLAEFAAGARLDADRWTLLHGDEGDILELAALLGIRYRRMANGEFIHSNLLTVLDRDGQVVHRQLGLGADPAATIRVIRSIGS